MDTAKLVQWKTDDAKLISCVLDLVDLQIVLNLRPYKTVRGMWEYRKGVYDQEALATRFPLENEISEYSHGNIFIQEYYFVFIDLQTEFIKLIYATAREDAISALQKVHEVGMQDQFLY